MGAGNSSRRRFSAGALRAAARRRAPGRCRETPLRSRRQAYSPTPISHTPGGRCKWIRFRESRVLILRTVRFARGIDPVP